MPQPDDATRLHHILDSARKAVYYVEGRTRADVEQNELMALGLVRLLEIIGEAASGITDNYRLQHSEIPWRQMSNMRNRLIHGYFDVNFDLVWATVTRELPPLIVDLEKIMVSEDL